MVCKRTHTCIPHPRLPIWEPIEIRTTINALRTTALSYSPDEVSAEILASDVRIVIQTVTEETPNGWHFITNAHEDVALYTYMLSCLVWVTNASRLEAGLKTENETKLS